MLLGWFEEELKGKGYLGLWGCSGGLCLGRVDMETSVLP